MIRKMTLEQVKAARPTPTTSRATERSGLDDRCFIKAVYKRSVAATTPAPPARRAAAYGIPRDLNGRFIGLHRTDPRHAGRSQRSCAAHHEPPATGGQGRRWRAAPPARADRPDRYVGVLVTEDWRWRMLTPPKGDLRACPSTLLPAKKAESVGSRARYRRR